MNDLLLKTPFMWIEQKNVANCVTKPFREVLQKAAKGDYDSQMELASMYENGRGATLDFGMAEFWYERAAMSHNPEASNEVGLDIPTADGS
jgi:TPR repeat protein